MIKQKLKKIMPRWVYAPAHTINLWWVNFKKNTYRKIKYFKVVQYLKLSDNITYNYYAQLLL